MLRSHRRLLWALRKNFSTDVQTPKPKRVTHFDPKKMEIFAQDILDRELPLLTLTEGKAERPPFIMEIFKKNFDERFLTYPEVLENPRIEEINALYKEVKSYVDSLPPDCMNNGPPAAVMQALASLGVFKILLPFADGGSELTATEQAKIMEAFAAQPSLAAIVATHNIAGIRTIAHFAAEVHRTRLLPLLTAGKPVIAFAVDDDTFAESRTTAAIDGDDCIINGKKVFVKNGKYAETFLVNCDFHGEGESGQASVLVDRKVNGLRVENSPNTHGLKGCGLATVHFNNVRVPKDCILGTVGKRSRVAENVSGNMRCALSAAAVGPCREAFERAFRHTFHNERFSQLLCSFQLIQDQITLMALDLFTMESCTYFSLAIEDVVLDPDIRLESVATALTCLEASKRLLNRSADIFGASGKRLNHDSTRWLDDLVTSPFLFSSPREHELSLARIGLQATAKKVAEDATKPKALVPSSTAVGTSLSSIASKIVWKKADNHLKNGTLYQFLHPSILKSANILDYMQRDFGSICEKLVQKFGADVVKNEVILQHISRMTLDIFSLSNVLSRASRSYCIGHYSSYEEIKIGSVYSRIVLARFEPRSVELHKIIKQGTLPSETELAASFLAVGRYFVPHPTRKLQPEK